MRGGYQIIDFQNIPITTGTEETIPGIYEMIEGSYRKATMISGLVLNGIELPNFFCKLTKGRDSYIGTIGIEVTNETSVIETTITISVDDGVTITTSTVTSA